VNGWDGANASKWYDLLKIIAADIRGKSFKDRLEQLEKYKALYDSVRAAHVGYAQVFTKLLSDLLAATSELEIENARQNFLDGRSSASGDRYLTKHDADTYLGLTDDLADKRFLASVVVYFCYDMDSVRYGRSIDSLDMMIWDIVEFGGDKGWNSASTAFWSAVQHSEDNDELFTTAKGILEAIAARFALVEQTFSELEGNWRHDKPLSASLLTNSFNDFPRLGLSSPKNLQDDRQ
jgi:hypothetical protein